MSRMLRKSTIMQLEKLHLPFHNLFFHFDQMREREKFRYEKCALNTAQIK